MRTAVLGAGIMGTGIAQVCAEAGLDVVLESRSLANLRRRASGSGKTSASSWPRAFWASERRAPPSRGSA